MLTISKPLSAGQARRYHAEEFRNARENYYTAGDQIHGHWHGQLARSWGLSGEVDQTQFERLAEGHSDRLTALLKTMGRFHKYSWHNVALIATQCPTATRVAGFQTWRTMGRFVRKGEKGIAILAPIIGRRRDASDDDAKGVLGLPRRSIDRGKSFIGGLRSSEAASRPTLRRADHTAAGGPAPEAADAAVPAL